MAEVSEIKFAPDMLKALLRGEKICTTRSEPKGQIGDLFRIEDHGMWMIAGLVELPLRIVRDQLYRAEGFDSPAAFEKRWKELHRGHFNPDVPRWVHFIERT